MQHDTCLWTVPYNDPKYGEEKGASFKYFKEFLKCNTPRSLVDFHKVLSKNLSKDGRKRIPSYQTLCEYSSAWKWFMRAEAYDNYVQDVETEQMRQTIQDIRNQAIQDIQNRFEMHRELEKELKSNTEMNTNQKIYGFAKDTEGFKNNVSAFNDLVNEGKTKVDADIDADVTGDTQLNVNGSVSIEERLKNYETYFNKIDSETEGNTSRDSM